MELQNKLKQLGWFLKEEFFVENAEIKDFKQLQSKALNTDLREISKGGLPSDINKGGKVESLMENVILQILKVRNVAAPKVNEESKFAPRMLKILFTDGLIQYSGLELEPIGSLSLNTVPGTKVLLKNGPIENSQGLLLLKADHIQVLGGNVEAMVEKWEVSRSMMKFAKGNRVGLAANGGPPPWIPFGKKIIPLKSETDGTKFKSLTSTKSAEKEENTEFDSQRQDAIAEANRLGLKKNFGGGNKTLIDANVQKIMDEGYSEADAVHFLRIAKNNVRNALNILKNRNTDPSERFQRPPKKERTSKQRDDDYDASNTGAPTTKISLFDFLEDKLPLKDTQDYSSGGSKKYGTTNAPTTYRNADKRNDYPKYPSAYNNSAVVANKPTPAAAAQSANRYENNISASFNKKSYPPKPENATSHHKTTNNNYGSSFNKANSSSTPYESGYNKGSSSQRSNYRNENYNSSNKNDISTYGKGNPRSSTYGNQHSSQPLRQERSSSERTPYPKTKSDSASSYRSNDNQSQYSQQHHQSGPQTKYQPHNSQGPYNSSNQEQPYKSSAYESKSQNYNNNKNPTTTSSSRPANNYLGQNKQQKRVDLEPAAVPAATTGNKPGKIGLSIVSSQPSKAHSNSKNTKNTSSSHPRLQQEIIGFQNSKTNEYAMNMLKTQQAMETLSVKQKPAAQTPAPRPTTQNLQAPPAPAPSSNVYQTQQPNEFNWTIGEKCLAKYWEDGKFYLAEITAVSQFTNVVHFLEYGNYEEILKKDCKPPVPHVNNHNMAIPYPPYQATQFNVYQQQPPPNNYYIQQQTPPSYGGRQVYVPNSRQ